MSTEVESMVLRCEKTGKLFFTEAEAKQHGDDTGLAEFASAWPLGAGESTG